MFKMMLSDVLIQGENNSGFNVCGTEVLSCETKSEDNISEALLNLKKKNQKVVCLGICGKIAEYNELQLNAIKGFIDYAVEHECENVKICIELPTDNDGTDEGIARMLAAACDYGSIKGVGIFAEKAGRLSDSLRMLRLIKNIRNIKIVWNAEKDGENAEKIWSVLGEYIAVVCLTADSFAISVLSLLDSVNYNGFVMTGKDNEKKTQKQYVGFGKGTCVELIQDYKDNLINDFDTNWSLCRTEFGDRIHEISVSRLKTYAMISVNPREAMKKYEYKIQIFPGESYKISVPYEIHNSDDKLAAYGLISLADRDGNVMRRLYLNRCAGERMEIVFKSNIETECTLELGMKRAGSVFWYRPVMIKCNELPKREVCIAAVHIEVKCDCDYSMNVKRIGKAFDDAAEKGADIVVFAETIADRGTKLSIEEKFEEINNPYCAMMRKKAAQHKCYAVFTFHEKDGCGARHNTSLLVDRNGEIVGRYVKSHQALGEYEDGMIPGNEYPVFETDFGKIGMLICWDAYFPEPAKAMALKGAEILFVSTAGNPTHRHIARAMENGVYVAVACAAREGECGIMPTKIISPTGRVIDDTNRDGECAIAQIDLNDNEYIYWLSVGAANSVPRDVYENEYRGDMYGLINKNE